MHILKRKNNMSKENIELPNWIIEYLPLMSGSAAKIFMYFCSRAGTEYLASPEYPYEEPLIFLEYFSGLQASHEEIAKATGLKAGNMSRHISNLQKLGVIIKSSIKHSEVKDGVYVTITTNQYTIPIENDHNAT